MQKTQIEQKSGNTVSNLFLTRCLFLTTRKKVDNRDKNYKYYQTVSLDAAPARLTFSVVENTI